MNKSLKIISLFLLLLSFFACDTSSEDQTMVSTETLAKYTYVRENSPGKITFINTSQNANSYTWDFGDGTTSTIKNPVKTFTSTGDYEVTLTATFSKTGISKTFKSTISVFIFAGGLITNGNFETGTQPWTIGITDNLGTSLLVNQNGNTYFSIPVNAAGNPFDVNLSHKGLNLTQGTTYRLTFDAWSDVSRSIVVGIGLSGDPWTNTVVIRNIDTSVQSFTVDLVANFTNNNSRVIFDMGAATGRVNIDNVTLNQISVAE